MRLMWLAELPHDLKLTVPPRVVGTALVAVGVAVAIHPPLLQLISGVTDGGATGM